MENANIAFYSPTSMRFGEKRRIHLLLSLRGSIDDLLQILPSDDDSEGAMIRVTGQMQAVLKGDGFKIDALTPSTQAITRLETTDWQWQISAIAGGVQSLHLTLNAILSIGGDSAERTMRVFERQIDIQITLIERVTLFVERNWQWLWAAILVPVAPWVWRRRNGPKRQAIGFSGRP